MARWPEGDGAGMSKGSSWPDVSVSAQVVDVSGRGACGSLGSGRSAGCAIGEGRTSPQWSRRGSVCQGCRTAGAYIHTYSGRAPIRLYIERRGAWCAARRPRPRCRSRLAGGLRASRTARWASRRVHRRAVAKQKPPRCSNKWASSAQHWLQQQGAGDLTLPLVLNEHDGTTNSNAVSVIIALPC